MGSKKKNTTTPGGNLPTLRIGSRVRCTDDGVTGRIVWANAVAVKIKDSLIGNFPNQRVGIG
jgi:hypothetical protein